MPRAPGMSASNRELWSLITSDPARVYVADHEAVVLFYDFTPCESRLAALAASGMMPAEIAKSLGVDRVTMRSQLRSILAKTGTQRLRELVWLLNILPPLVANAPRCDASTAAACLA